MSGRGWMAALFLGAFAIGCTEFIVVGLLPQIAEDLDATEAAVGQLVTLNALAVAIGAPLLVAATDRFERRTIMLAALGAFTLAHAIAALAPSLAVLMATRLLSGAAFGLYIATAIATAASLVEPSARGRAMGTVVAGVSTATALGVPLGTLLGQGAGWRAPFAAIGACAMVAALAIAVTVPHVRAEAGPPLRDKLGVLGHRPVLLALGAIVLFWGASFTAYTYLAPLLSQRAGLEEGAITLVLLLVGVMAVTGNVLGGRAADRNLRLTLMVTAAVAAGALLLLGPASESAAAVIAVVAAWQLAAWCFPPAVQVQVYRAGGAAADLAVSFSVSAFNVGIVLGAALGGVALGAGGLTAVTTTAAAIGLVALGTILVLVRRPRAGRAPAVTGHPQCPPVRPRALSEAHVARR